MNAADELNKANHLRPGRKAIFTVGHDDTHEPDYSARNGEVVIVRELVVGVEVDEECAPMYRVERDGDKWDAFEDELTPIHPLDAGVSR